MNKENYKNYVIIFLIILLVIVLYFYLKNKECCDKFDAFYHLIQRGELEQLGK